MNRTCTHLIQALLAGTALSQPLAAGAAELPRGGTTVYGAVGIATPTANQMTIQQTTPTAIVNWQSFSIGAGGRVDITQPANTSALLNRVTGATTSTIAGQINANGQVYLVNPNGIAITPTGTVKAAGFVASTLDISDGDFASGRRTFRGGGQSAAVSNQGTIDIQAGGYAALLGGRVENAGVISVPLGRVGLGAGEQATLDLSGDGFLQVAIPSRNDGSNAALIQHSGRIAATGGRVVMQAATARDAARNAINLSGLVEARSISGRNGAIVLGGGDGGAVAVSGRLDTSARSGGTRAQRPARGGDITVTGSDIRLTGAALLADGRTGGGTIRVGGGFQGQGPLQRAATTTVDAATTISANAGRTGNGGDVVIWSDRATDFAGRISATGGAQGGDGGRAEVSGKTRLAYSGTTILTAEHGAFGTLLLDPYNVTISTAADANQTSFAASGDNSVINAATLQTALRSANVTVTTGGAGSPGTQAGDITVAAPLTWGTGTGGAATVLTLSAYHSIAIGANLTVSGDGGLALNTNQGGTGGPLSFAPGASASFTAVAGTVPNQTLQINSQPYTLLSRADQLATFLTTQTSASGRFALASDVDATGVTLNRPLNTSLPSANVPFGTDIPFTGGFNGLGHTVNGLTIASSNPYVGLFGTMSNATIESLNLTNVTVRGTYAGTSSSYVGGLVGQATNTSLFRVTVSGTVTNASTSTPSFATTGGLAGSASGTVRQSFSTATVAGSGNAGASSTGGLLGQNFGTVSQSYATGAVSTGNVTGSFVDAGGLIGQNHGQVTQSYATGNVTGGASSGSGPAGDTDYGSFTGGLIGYSDGSGVQQVYATGVVVGGNSPLSNSYTGGLIGYGSNAVTQSYATGRVTGGTASNVFSGGLVGYNTGTATASFWDTTTTGLTAAAGNAASLSGATGLTTAQFQNPTTFVPLAAGQGWNVQTTWAPPSAGFYPELYSLSRVISITADPKTRVYGQANPTLTGTVAGGPGTYVFGTGTAPSAADLLTTAANAASGVGDYAISPAAGSAITLGGVSYRITGVGNTLSVTPAPLTITANDATKTAGRTLAFAGTEFTATGLVNNDQVTRVALASDGQPASAGVDSYPITASAAEGTGLVNPANNRSNYDIAYRPGTLTVAAAIARNDDGASQLNSATVNPNITTILPNFSTSALALADSLDTSSGGGPTIGSAQGSQDAGGSQTRAGAQNTLGSVQRAANTLEAQVAACDRSNKSGLRGITTCYSTALDSFADTLEIQTQQLPPAFRSLPAVIRRAATQVRAAKTVAQARAAVRVAVVEVRKAIALLRADEPAVRRIQVRQGNAIASALRTVDNRLSRAVGL